MKKLCLLLSLILLTTSAILPAQASAGEIVFPLGKATYQMNGLQMPMDAQVFMESGRIYVPLRYLGEALGAQVQWLGNGDKAGLIILTKGKDGVIFRMDKKDYTVIRGQVAALMEMDVTPQSKDGRIYLPARYVTSAFGYNLVFNEMDNALHISQVSNATKDVDAQEVNSNSAIKDEKVITGLLNSFFMLYALVP